MFCALAVPGLVYSYLSRPSISLYLGIVGVLIVFNLLTQVSLSSTKNIGSPLVICFQLAADLFFLTCLLGVSQGVSNPFLILFLLNISLGAILIPGRLSRPFVLLGHSLLGVLQFQYILKNEGFISFGSWTLFLISHLFILGFWLVMRSLGTYLEKQSESHSSAKVALEKQDRLRAVGALAAGFSHEFASPLNVAKIRLERLRRNYNPEDLDEAILAIETCQNVIQQMNSSQLDTRDLVFKEVVVADLVTDVIESWSEDKENFAIEKDLDASLKVLIPAVNFAQVLINLLDNAYEANPHGKIQVHLKCENVEICLSVKDEGPGISDSVLRQRGEPFVTTKKDGTGLGLYVTELFVQSLGGKLKMKNVNPRGAEVSLVWPLKESTR